MSVVSMCYWNSTISVVATEGADAYFAFEGRDNDFTYRVVTRG